MFPFTRSLYNEVRSAHVCFDFSSHLKHCSGHTMEYQSKNQSLKTKIKVLFTTEILHYQMELLISHNSLNIFVVSICCLHLLPCLIISNCQSLWRCQQVHTQTVPKVSVIKRSSYWVRKSLKMRGRKA